MLIRDSSCSLTQYVLVTRLVVSLSTKQVKEAGSGDNTKMITLDSSFRNELKNPPDSYGGKGSGRYDRIFIFGVLE